MKKITVQISVGLLLTLAALLLAGTCYISYRNLSSIVSTLQTDIKPALRLVSIRDISRTLEKADNSIRLYSVTEDTLELPPYYRAISSIDEKVNKLRDECLNDTLFLSRIDTISEQIEENIVAWNQILYLIHDDKVVENLKKLSDKVDSVAENNQKKGRGILRRVFSSGDKNILNELELASNLQEIEQQDSLTKKIMRERESNLANISSRISDKLYELISNMENEVFVRLQQKTHVADQIAGQTYNWLIMFSISGGLLVLLVLFIIIRFTRKTYEYQTALEYSKGEAENLARTKEMFMANMSHEIRTPVTAIAGFTEQLMHEPLNENVKGILKIIKSSSDYLVRIINDILDFSRLQNEKMVLEKVHFNIDAILREVYNIFENQARNNNTVLSFSLSDETPHILSGDPYRLKQVIVNLVSNAIKFTRDGKVKYSVRSVNKKFPELELIVEVTDTGIGIDETKQKIIFEDFIQAEISTSRKYGGTGLGLSIVKKIIELHKGKIECESKVGMGTRITCYIPYNIGDEKQVRAEIDQPVTIPEKIKNLKILIADDEEYNRLLFKKIMDRWDIKHDEAANGLEAIEKLKARNYDLLFMDIRMPEMDGIRASKYIREEMKIPEHVMPIIFISAVSTDEDRKEYLKSGANAFLQKPFTEEDLLSAMLDMSEKQSSFKVSEEDSDDSKEIIPKARLNLNNLYHISGGNEEFVKQMLESFITTTEKGLADLNSSVLNKDYNSASEVAHKLLPPCHHLGAEDLYNSLIKIEKGIANYADPIIFEALVRESQREYERVKKLLADIIAKME